MTTYRKNFNDCYAYGRIGEGSIAKWARKVFFFKQKTAYEIEIPSGKGPRLLLDGYELIAPDFYAIRIDGTTVLCKWIEAKHKTRFTWHFMSGNWQTGIDRRHYEDYLQVQEVTQTIVYIMFLHRSNIPSEKDLAKGSPCTCPTGLYCRSIDYLKMHEHHKDSYEKDGREYPMVYWNERPLGPPIATFDEVNAISSSPNVIAKTLKTKLAATLQQLENTYFIPDDDNDPYAWERGMQEADRTSIIMANDDEEQLL